MSYEYDLAKIGPHAFENLANFLAMNVLGAGLTGFGPGADGGRDGYFKGEAPYPSEVDRWKGVWYIQSKFHAPHLSKDPQKWLVDQVAAEIKSFDEDESSRQWPDIWIICTNIDVSGKPETGSFDRIVDLVAAVRPRNATRVAIWGGRKVLDLLVEHPNVAKYYGHFLTPGHIITRLYESLQESRANLEEVIRHLVVTQFMDHRFTKLDQAGSSSDLRPGVHDLFIDLPYRVNNSGPYEGLLSELSASSQQCHRYSLRKVYPQTWIDWSNAPRRARALLIKGGPGQGKSTLGQYLAQIQRAKMIVADYEASVHDTVRLSAAAVVEAASRDGLLPTSPRIPVQLDLKEFAHWRAVRPSGDPIDVISYIGDSIGKRIGVPVAWKLLKSAFAEQAWLFVFDGLDEVPNDSKDGIAAEILSFLNDTAVAIDADIFAICTSRPQGYSGQFSSLDGPTVDLAHLSAAAALRCAKPVLEFGRVEDEAKQSYLTLETAIRSPSIQELMTTPLQSHIMAVVVRDGGRPPERRWQLFNSFYLVKL